MFVSGLCRIFMDVSGLLREPLHIGEPGKVEGGFFHSHIWSRSNQQWYDVQDLHVKETMPQLVALSESYIQIWERVST